MYWYVFYKQRFIARSGSRARMDKASILGVTARPSHIALAAPNGPEDADRSTCRMLDPTTTKTKNPNMTGPTEKCFFFVIPASTAPRR